MLVEVEVELTIQALNHQEDLVVAVLVELVTEIVQMQPLILVVVAVAVAKMVLVVLVDQVKL